MKKLLFVMIAMFGMMFTSCHNKVTNEVKNDSTLVDSDSVSADTVDTIVVDTLAK